MLKIHVVTAAALLSASVAGSVFAPAVQAKGYNVIHSFAGAPADGDMPRSDVTFDGSGNLYGTTYGGGTSDNGTVFKIAPNGTETLLHSFDGGSGGANPAAGVTIGNSTGDLYGVTFAGGSAGFGIMYKLTASGTFTVLHTFAGQPNDGRYPQWRMISDARGNLYGVSEAGGSLDLGTLFKYGAGGTFKILHAFDSTAYAPTGRLARDRAGNLYGVTGLGGSSTSCSGHSCGTVYRLSPDGTFVILYSFTNNDDGRYPVGGLEIDRAGNLYGTAGYGGAGDYGTVFELPPGGDFTTLYSFNGTNGASPVGDVLSLGTDLYLATYGGGANGYGTVVKVSSDGTGTVLHNFTGDHGGSSAAGLVKGERLLYGTAISGGDNNHGVVFSVRK